MLRTPECHPDRPHGSRGLCDRCYAKWHYRTNKDRYDKKAKEWRINNPERDKTVRSQYIKNNPERYLLKTARFRAKKYNLDFNITLDDVKIPSVCPVLGIPLVPFSGRFHPNSPSIDRIDNSKGYVKGNTLVVSFRANSLKKDATPKELNQLASFYTELCGGTK